MSEDVASYSRPTDPVGRALYGISRVLAIFGSLMLSLLAALTAVSVAGLTIYDMCKAVDRAMRIDAVRLAKKSGGKSGDIVLEE